MPGAHPFDLPLQGDTEHIRAAIDVKQKELEPHSDRLNKQRAKVDMQQTEVTLLTERLTQGQREAESLQKLHDEVNTASLSPCFGPASHIAHSFPPLLVHSFTL